MVLDETEKTAENLSDEELQKQLETFDFSTLKSASNEEGNNNTAGIKSKSLLKPDSLKPSMFKTNLERFKFVCKDLPSCDLFILFDFYFMISACLARRCWIGEGDMHKLYPNQYIVKVAKPGLGKSLSSRTASKILDSLVETKYDPAAKKLVELKLLNLGPDAITYEKLILRAAASIDYAKLPNGKLYSHSSTTFCLSEELGMLLAENTRKVVSFLMAAYDCHRFEGDTIKHGIKIINNICVNFLAGTTPGIMKGLMQTKVLDDGFTGRAIHLYTDKKRPHPPLIKQSAEQVNEVEHIRRHLKQLCKITPTELTLSPDAKAWLEAWHEKYENNNGKKLNNSNKLLDYYARKRMHMVKLAMVHAMADKIAKEISVEDFIGAEKMLNAAEIDMHKALAGNDTNPLATLAESIVTYIETHGTCTRKKLILQFYSEAKDDIEGINKALDFLISTDQCKVVRMEDGKEGIAVIKQKQQL